LVIGHDHEPSSNINLYTCINNSNQIKKFLLAITLHDMLSIRQNLYHRAVIENTDDDSLSVLCGLEFELVDHLSLRIITYL
jgi:hypothetical protein